MKIIGTQGPKLTEVAKQGKRADGMNGDFKKVMKEVMNKVQSNAPSTSNMVTTGLVQDPGMLKPIDPVPGEAVVGQVEVMLDKVDFYAEKLADPSIPITDLSPLMDDMQSGAMALENMITNGKVPPALNNIVSDLIATITSEVEKFRRGDYS